MGRILKEQIGDGKRTGKGRNDDDDDGIPHVALYNTIRKMEFAGFTMLLTIVVILFYLDTPEYIVHNESSQWQLFRDCRFQ